MCAIYGFLNYKKGLSNKALRRLIKHLSIEAEVRGTHATGISYVSNGNVFTYKQPKPAHKVKLKFPKRTKAVIGHTRYTTQGSEKLNYNNHPFEGECENGKFALAHNGVLWNDKELREDNNLPDTHIETDSYIAVQLLEQQGNLDFDSLKYMAESIEGSFMLTILRKDNTLFLVKGSNPITIYHFPELGIYIYASTKEILEKALDKTSISGEYEEIVMREGDIMSISPDGVISSSEFDDMASYGYGYTRRLQYVDEIEDEVSSLEHWFHFYGMTREDIYALLDYGYTVDDLWEMVDDPEIFEHELSVMCGTYC